MPPQEAGTSSATSTEASIAVLPFANLSDDKSQDYFADGLSEELLNQLARLKDLRVIGRTSSFAFKGKNEDLRTIGTTLGVNHLLEGSVRKSGDDVRITAQLINSGDGSHIWSKTYDRKLDDVFAIQDEIAMAVADALQVTLGVGELARVPGMTRDAAAYDEYLRANAILSASYVTDAEATLAGIGHLEKAVAIDPTFALAWLTLAQTYGTVGAGIVAGRVPDALEKARRAGGKAVALAPDSPFVLEAQAMPAAAAGNWKDAESYFTRALATARQYSLDQTVEVGYSRFLIQTGRVKEALSILESAQAVNPLDLDVNSGLMIAYAATGESAAASAVADRGMATEGIKDDFAFKTYAALIALGSHDKQEIEKRLAAMQTSPASATANATAAQSLSAGASSRRDDPQAALAFIRRESPKAQSFDVMPLASWASFFGDPDLALSLFRRVPREAEVGLAAQLWLPLFADARKLPAFKDLMRDLGFVDYWRSTGKWNDFCHPVGADDFECS
jgi:TolB-like protein/Tfp pilus assembly protein PilF